MVSVTGTITRSGKHTGKGDKGDKKGPGVTTATADDDGTALLDELAPWEADEAELAADDPALPGPGRRACPRLPRTRTRTRRTRTRTRRRTRTDKDGKKGERGRRGGGELAGKDFAFTIDVPSKPQKFSQPTIGEKGSLAACSGGGAPVEVTRGGFKTRDGNADEAKGDGARAGATVTVTARRRGRRGWRR